MSRQECFNKSYAALEPLQKATSTIYELLAECIQTDDDGQIIVEERRLEANAAQVFECCNELSELDDGLIDELCGNVSEALFNGATDPPNLRNVLNGSRKEAGRIRREVQCDLDGEIAFQWRDSLESLKLCGTTISTFCEAVKRRVDATFLATPGQGPTP